MSGRLLRVKIKLRGVNEIMRSPEVQAELDAVGENIAAAAGDGFYYQPRPHKWTARGYVGTMNARARRREAEDKVLIGALAAGRR